MNLTVYEARRFWTKVNIDGPQSTFARRNCWVWTATKSRQGYGALGFRGGRIYAHVLSFILHKGPIPQGKEIDHKCRTRNCVRPEHLRTVTHRVNVLCGNTIVAELAARTHCLRGHPLSGDNLYVYEGKRGCFICRREQSNNYNKSHRKSEPA